MKRNPILAAMLSLLVPGLGQIYGGESTRGAAILVSAIIVGNLNIIVLPLISLTIPIGTPDEASIWAYWIPRVVHDVMSIWSIVFLIWVVFDAFSLARQKRIIHDSGHS